LFLRCRHRGKGVHGPCPALGKLLTLEELGEGAGPLGLGGVPHVPHLDGVVGEVEADDELPVAVLAVGVLWKLGQAEEAEKAAVVMQKLGQLVIGLLGLMELQLAPWPHSLPLLL